MLLFHMLDYVVDKMLCLKFFVGHNSYEKALAIIIGNHVVNRVVNPSSWIIEYIVHEHGNHGVINELEPKKSS